MNIVKGERQRRRPRTSKRSGCRLYSPELNRRERWFEGPRERLLSNRVFKRVEAIMEALSEALRPYWECPPALAKLNGCGWMEGVLTNRT